VQTSPPGPTLPPVQWKTCPYFGGGSISRGMAFSTHVHQPL